MKVLLIIPAYNEQDNILKVVNSIKGLASTCNEYELDYIVINDDLNDCVEEVRKIIMQTVEKKNIVKSLLSEKY